MTVFEDLIVELKEENLLEDTVLSVDGTSNGGRLGHHTSEEHDFGELIDADTTQGIAKETGSLRRAMRDSQKAPVRSLHRDALAEQISTLQTVEHIVASIERSSLGKDLSGFDELRAKKALHAFQQASADPSSREFADAQSELIAEVSTWKESLASRDEQISVSEMRRYCETCQPALSAQALFSLARFARSLPYSELCRGKYEFVVTRLFSKQSDGEKRTPICSKDEMLGHLRNRFTEPREGLPGSQSESADLTISSLGFEEMAAEAENTRTLDEMIGADYFRRLYEIKQQTNEDFFTPEVSAAVIGCNIRVLNKLIDLVAAESERTGPNAFTKKFGAKHDEAISNAVGKSVELVSLGRESSVDAEAPSRPLRQDRIDSELIEKKRERVKTEVAEKKTKPTIVKALSNVNRWLLASTIIVVILSVGLYFWVNYSSDTASAMSKDVKVVDLSTSQFKDVIKEARISGDTFYGLTLPAWDNLSRENQQETIGRIYKNAAEQGCKRVSLMNSKGQTVGSAVEGRADIFRP